MFKSKIPKGTKLYKREPIADRFWRKVDRPVEGCWNWTGAIRQNAGYGQFNIDRYPEFSHRVAWVLTFGPIPEGKYVLHACDNRKCCRPDHLFLGTQKENVHDMMAKGRDACIGERNHSYKLTNEQVAEIRLMVKQGSSKAKVARAFKVSHQYVSDLTLNRRRRNEDR